MRPSVEEIQKSVTAKFEAFPIVDFSRSMKRLEYRVNDSIRMRREGGLFWINITCLNFRLFFTFFETLSQYVPTHLVNWTHFKKNLFYKLNEQTDIGKILFVFQTSRTGLESFLAYLCSNNIVVKSIIISK